MQLHSQLFVHVGIQIFPEAFTGLTVINSVFL